MSLSTTCQNEHGHPVAPECPISPEQVADFAQQCLADMLDIPLDTTPLNNSIADDAELQGVIRVAGDSRIELRVIASEALAVNIACAMFDMSQEELGMEETWDALGEIANIIGGNLKGIIDNPGPLSIPCVGELDEEMPAGPYYTYDCAGQQLTLLLHPY